MITPEVTVNIFALLAISLLSVFLGLFVRKNLTKKSNLRISELENEMLNNHKEILELQKENIRLNAVLYKIHTTPFEKKEESEVHSNKQEADYIFKRSPSITLKKVVDSL